MVQALVTGGSRGIGRSIAAELVRQGHDVVITGRESSTLVEAARAIGAQPIVLDAGDTQESVRVIRALDERVPLDLVIANAGVGMPDPLATPWAWESMKDAFHTNFCGAAATLTAALPAMVARARGHVVGISSLAAFGALPAAAAYCAPKAGLDMLLDCLRIDLAKTNVAVTRVSLGFVRTKMVERSTHPMPQILDPDDVARTIVKRLAKRPSSIVIPRALAVVAKGISFLPAGLKAR